MTCPARLMSSAVPWVPDDPHQIWARAVELGAHGRYLPAWRLLTPLVEPFLDGGEADQWVSLAASTRASHLRQVGNGQAAAQWDALAMQRAPIEATHADAHADALVGAAADALATGDLDSALSTWETARPVAGAAGQRSLLRWHWVGAEMCLFDGSVAQAQVHARTAVQVAATLGPRHRAKTSLITSAVYVAGGNIEDATTHLRTAQDLLTRGQWATLWWPAALLWLDLEVAGVHDPAAEVAIHAGARAVQVIDLHLPVAEGDRWRARADVQRILEGVERYPAQYGAAR
jgi:hypothetical protein